MGLLKMAMHQLVVCETVEILESVVKENHADQVLEGGQEMDWPMLVVLHYYQHSMLTENCVGECACVGADDGAFLYARKAEVRDYLHHLAHLHQ